MADFKITYTKMVRGVLTEQHETVDAGDIVDAGFRFVEDMQMTAYDEIIKIEKV